MAAVDPFETRPLLAVAVSGGADSMALCLLAHAWAAAREGRILALTVDHDLRPASAAEAECVGRWLSEREIEHEILCWSGEKPRTGVAAKARQARYRLLFERCRARGALHLLVGHHLQDQAETVLMRAARGSGGHGLAAMAPVLETDCVRVIRPLLAVPPLRLRAHLMARAQPWIEDPSNRGTASGRGRIRAELPAMTAAGWSPEAMAVAAAGRAMERARDEAAVAALLAKHCRLHPAGFATLDAAAVTDPPPELATGVLARLAATVGGKAFPPAAAALARLRSDLAATGRGAAGRCTWTLMPSGPGGGCDAARILVCRETRRLPPPRPLEPPGELIWDGRFWVRVGRLDAAALSAVLLSAMSEADWREAIRTDPSVRSDDVPRQAALTLPVLRDARGLLAIPTLGWLRGEGTGEAPPAARAVSVAFRPRRGLSGTGYFLA